MQVEKIYKKEKKRIYQKCPQGAFGRGSSRRRRRRRSIRIGAAAEEGQQLKKRGNSRRCVLAPNFNATLSHLSDATCKMLPTAV